jgi:UDP-N-acetyl-D-mannosaminuronate dehydrogenase
MGLGYTGLPLSRAFAEAGLPVFGFDTHPGKVETLTADRSYIGTYSPKLSGQWPRKRAASTPAVTTATLRALGQTTDPWAV